MRVDLFDFHLPPERIALRPAQPRDAARLLVVGSRDVQDRIVRDLPDLLEKGDVLVVNDTRVVPARLEGVRRRGETAARISVLLHLREAPDRWRAFARPAKRLEIGDRIAFGASAASPACLLAGLEATVEAKGEGGEVVLRFELAGPALDEAVSLVGAVPLPPYIAARRVQDAADRADYQTLFASRDGAIAAPTAGLHFTPALLEGLERRGIGLVRVTLHVGAGTFLPVKAQETEHHRMAAEWGEVSPDAAASLNAARAAGGRIIAVGTTSLRLLESASAPDGRLSPWSGTTQLFITPGYRFKIVQGLMTNFHLPRSTLFMLVSAFAGLERMQAAYAHAIAAGYRFYSYGDACLLLPVPEASPA